MNNLPKEIINNIKEYIDTMLCIPRVREVMK